MFCNKCKNEITPKEYHTLGGMCEECYDKKFKNDDYKSGSSAGDYLPTFDLFSAQTYSWDKELFDKLGLEYFTLKAHDKKYLGEYKFPNYEKASVKITVMVAPAQFWEFKIQQEEGGIVELHTGSGSLSDYWDTIEKFATSMIVIKNQKSDECAVMSDCGVNQKSK